MAVIDIIIPSRHGMPQECNGAYGELLRATACRCGTHLPWECDQGRHSIREIPKPVGSSIVHWARNHVITTALYGMNQKEREEAGFDIPGRPPADFFFLMDDDMLPGPTDLLRLISHNRSIVTGIATIRRDPPKPNIRKYTKKGWVPILKWDWDSEELFEVDGVGAAFMLVRRKVFEKMGQAYLNAHFEREVDCRKFGDRLKPDVDNFWNLESIRRREIFDKATKKGGEWEKANCWWFEFLRYAEPEQDGEFGEDISFCWKARHLGYKIWADPQVQPGHLGDYAYSVKDHRGYVELQEAAGFKVPTWDE